MKRADRLSALLLLGVCLAAWLAALRFSPLSALFPRVIIVILGALSLLLLVLSFVRPSEERAFVLIHGNGPAVALIVVLMVVWVALIGVFGFLATSLACFSLMVILLDRRVRPPLAHVRRIALVSVLTVVFYLFFDRLLIVSFPRGLLM